LIDCVPVGYTHLLMESVCVTTHRHLSPLHPIHRLLAPHFLFLPAVNASVIHTHSLSVCLFVCFHTARRSTDEQFQSSIGHYEKFAIVMLTCLLLECVFSSSVF